jgi:hypothetical protein
MGVEPATARVMLWHIRKRLPVHRQAQLRFSPRRCSRL